MNARKIAMLVGSISLATLVGCAAEGEETEVVESEQALRASADGSDDLAASPSKRPAANVQQTGAGSWTAVQTSGGTVFGQGTIVVGFVRDPDGSWHCTGDADCNKMFLAGVCKGGILDSSCDTTGTVECWCY